MDQLDRRQWLRTAGLTGVVSLFGGLKAIADSTDYSVSEPPIASIDSPIRLSSNENPFGPSQKVREAIVNAFDMACRYPYGYSQELTEMIAKKHGVSPESVVITGGSTEGLKIAGLTYGIEGGEIVAADPVYKSLISYAEQFGAYIHKVPVDQDLNHDLDAMYQRITNRTSLVYLCNPNNPTGTLIPGKPMIDFCESVSKTTMVFVDEAYFDYIEEPDYPSADQLVQKGENVIVARTFSKVFGLAGIRIGYMIARPDVAVRLRKNMMAFTNVLALFAAKTAMEDEEFYQYSLARNKEAKQVIYQTLDELQLRYVPSHTNFVFFHSGRPINTLINDMLAEGVRIGRPFPPLLDWCRISTGTLGQTEAFAKAIKKVMV